MNSTVTVGPGLPWWAFGLCCVIVLLVLSLIVTLLWRRGP